MKPHFEMFNSKYMAGCQQPFLVETAGDSRLSAGIASDLRDAESGVPGHVKPGPDANNSPPRISEGSRRRVIFPAGLL